MEVTSEEPWKLQLQSPKEFKNNTFMHVMILKRMVPREASTPIFKI